MTVLAGGVEEVAGEGVVLHADGAEGVPLAIEGPVVHASGATG